jgi:hypothetical protein
MVVAGVLLMYLTVLLIGILIGVSKVVLAIHILLVGEYLGCKKR